MKENNLENKKETDLSSEDQFKDGIASFKKYKVTLIDFNVAKRFLDLETGNSLRMLTNTGTENYKAPEILCGWMSYYDERIDLWSAGCVLYYILTGGKHAFDSDMR